MSSSTCSLACSNGGYCTKVAGDVIALEKDAYAGKLIEKCVCRPGWTGVGCSVPCSLDENGDYTCNCNIADNLSSFAGYMCRSPATEYCNSKITADSYLSFCTNGGKCLTHPLEDPQPFRHLGCQCPREFLGPHCEHLDAPGVQTMNEKPSRMSLTPFIVTGLILVLASIGYVVMRKRRRNTTTSRSGSFYDNVVALENHGNNSVIVAAPTPSDVSSESGHSLTERRID